MKILVTGSSGEIGTNLCIKLLEQNHDVIGVDKRPNEWNSKIKTIIHDLSNSFNEIIEPNIDILIHLAANAKVHELVLNPLKSLDNIIYTFNALEFCRKNKVPIIYSSSREVYGDIQRYITNEEEGDFHYTESPYSASKISGEAFVYSYKKCYNLPYIVFRFSNVYGRYDSDLERMERVIPLFLKKIRENKTITIYGKDKLLDFTFVDDCVNGIISGINNLKTNKVVNETFNLAFGEGHTLLELAQIIGKQLNINPKINFKNSRLGEVTHYVADINKAKKLLKFDPKTNLHDGIKNCIEWQKEFYK